MNFAFMKKCQTLLLSIGFLGICNIVLTVDFKEKIKQERSCIKHASIPCDKEFKSAKISGSKRKEYRAAWGNLYSLYLARNASTDPDSPQWEALKRNAFISNPFCQLTPLGQDPELIEDLQICLDFPEPDQYIEIIDCQTNIAHAYEALTVNYLTHMQEYLSSSLFSKLPNDPFYVRYNYATIHLKAALQRLSNVCKITAKEMHPKTYFEGEVQDLGIIVNVINNSNYEFHVTESLTAEYPIAHIRPGLNDVNLYTAALNRDLISHKRAFGPKSLRSKFCFFQFDRSIKSDNDRQPLFTVEIYTGAELIAFLKTLPRKDPNVFNMNGCPTSAEYLANKDDKYLVLIKHATTSNDANNSDQRIQAINLSAFTGPYLLTMQINEEDVTHDHTAKKNNSVAIIQPSFTSVQLISQKSLKVDADIHSTQESNKERLDRSLLPLIILPTFLWDIPAMKMFWMLHATSYISASTDFSNFGHHKFGSAYDYFNDLGYFEEKQKYQFIIDKYNILKCGECLYDAKQYMGCALYETALKTCPDISKIYSAIDEENNIVSNGPHGSNINFSMKFCSDLDQLPNQSFFNQHGFNSTYFVMYNQEPSLNFSPLALKTKETIFAHITKSSKNIYSIALIDKNDSILESKSIALNSSVSNIKIDYLTDLATWRGSMISGDFVPVKIGNSTEFKIVDQVLNQEHELVALPTSPIDKLKVVYTCIIKKYPITNLFFDIYEKFQVNPYYKLHIWQNENSPAFLQSLNEEDWRAGVYIVPTIKNNHNLSMKNPGFLTLIFYKSDKTILGSVSMKTKDHAISTPVYAYNVYSDQFKCMSNVYLSTGILIKYQPLAAADILSNKE